METNAGAIPALTTLTVDAPPLRSIEIRARPLYISTRREPLEVPRLSISLPTPAREKRTAFLASRQRTPLASNKVASSVAVFASRPIRSEEHTSELQSLS